MCRHARVNRVGVNSGQVEAFVAAEHLSSRDAAVSEQAVLDANTTVGGPQ